MLRAMFPRAHSRYSGLPVVGLHLEGLCVYLSERRYPKSAIQRRMQAARSLACLLDEQGVRSLSELTAPQLLAFAPTPRWSNSPPLGALVRSLTQYLEAEGGLRSPPATATGCRVDAFVRYLDNVRGLSNGTIILHARTATEFLRFLAHDKQPKRLLDLRACDVEPFIAHVSGRMGRGHLSHVISALRSFLRFLAANGDTPPGVAEQIEAPRIYRGERLPRALPWDTVGRFLQSIERASPKGRRDYAMFLLIATYGLRVSEVRALRLDDLAWRARQIRVPRPKAGSPIILPLVDEVATALLDYLRRGRPSTTHRELFLRVQAPIGPLGLGAVGDAFRTWARRADIPLPTPGGPHCLRHSLAVHLLRDGIALKTIGDLLGHRSAESTCVYLRLDVDDLRDVGLPLPAPGEEEELAT